MFCPIIFFNHLTSMPLELSGMAIFDTMKHIRPDVSTVCVGLAARYKILDLAVSVLLYHYIL